LVGVLGVEVGLNETQIATLTSAGVNPVRAIGSEIVVWGARTVSEHPDWKYVPVRRLALFIEESVSRGLAWAVVEPNDEKLWARLRNAVEQFLLPLWKQGAFLGAKASDAFFVRCDRTVVTQQDLQDGRTVVLFGFAALKPAEFIELRAVIAR
jgi:phage tail sheath protein FI